MKITVIFTGGTIGSTVGQDGYIATSREQPYKLLNMYRGTLSASEGEPVEFEIKEPYRILSENMNAHYLNALADCTREALEDRENGGIIITHGTDTLQYTSAMLSYMLRTDGMPVVLVSSDFPLEDGRANGLVNFAHAVDFICGEKRAGVYVSYCNKGENPKIYKGTRLFSHLPYSASLYGVEDVPFAGKMCYNSMAKAVGKPHADLRLEEDAGKILWIHPYVGMKYPKLGSGTEVVLHDSYHSGTIGISDNLKCFMKEAGRDGIPVYLTGASADEKEYETVREYKALGIRMLPKMSPVAAFCKLWLAVSCGLDVEYVMKTCIAEDFNR